MLYSYSYPESADGEVRPMSLAEVDARLSTSSKRTSGVSDATSCHTPSTRDLESGGHEGRSLTPEHNSFYGGIEEIVLFDSTTLAPMPIPRKSSKRKTIAWDQGSVSVNTSNSIDNHAVKRPGLGSERRSNAESVISEVDHLIERWDTVSIKTMERPSAVERRRSGGEIGKMSVEVISRMHSQKSTSSRAQSIISDEALELLGVGRRTGSFPPNDG